MAPSPTARLRDFCEFYRAYARTGAHAATTAALTGLGLLTFVHRGFAAAAVAAYVLPLLYLYASADGDDGGDRLGEEQKSEPGIGSKSGPESKPGSESKPEAGSKPGPESDPKRRTEPESEPTAEPRWVAADAPTDADLFDVAVAGGRAVAVGEGGVALVRDDDGWRSVFERGPRAASNSLRGVDAIGGGDATDGGDAADGDGGAVWVAGDGGVVARYDVETGRHADYSAPNGNTSTWEGIAVARSAGGGTAETTSEEAAGSADGEIAGSAGEEVVYLINGSGAVLRGAYRDGEVRWGAATKPGGGSSLSGVAFVDESLGFLCDTNAAVYETTDGGERYGAIGVDDAGGTFVDVAAVGPDAVEVAVDDGTVVRYDGSVWTRTHASDGGLRGIDRRGRDGFVCGDGGTICARRRGGWEAQSTPVTVPLDAVCVGDDAPSVAVGAGGAVVELR
ncbi:hypothetical protein [Halegenticoccus tardaugens]|uniref:hypothetical protein n=1 Tax=Halegenticoccus tardaugens TaxID=2071624 RepID=UPI00100AA34F|nr:hypothetical protein [Halegenticoccus tardaugens]